MTKLDLHTNFSEHVVKIINNVVPNIPNAIFNLIVGILIIRLLIRVTRFVMKLANFQPGLRGVLSSVVETVLWILLVVTMLNELGFNDVIYFFTGSIAAIGIAMAAGGSTLISDIVAGIFLARDDDFNVGDEVSVGEGPTQGTIVSMDSRRIRLRDDKGVLHVIPNSVVERKEWVVIKRHEGGASTPLPLAKATKAAKRLTAVARGKSAPFRKNEQ